MPSENNPQCTLIDRFSLKEKILTRTGWFAVMAVGFYGIYRQDPLWALLYAAFGIIGFSLAVFPGLCSHCPYPYKFSTCLFVPAELLRRFYPYRGPRMSLAGKVAAFVVLAGVFIIPQFWLVKDPPLLIVFWLAGLPAAAAFPLHFCRRCRHFDCPMNKAAGLQAERPTGS